MTNDKKRIVDCLAIRNEITRPSFSSENRSTRRFHIRPRFGFY